MSVREAIRGRQNAAFADFIAVELANRNMNVTDLIRAMGVSVTSSLRNVFRGEARASAKTIERIARVFDVEPGVLAALYVDERRPKREVQVVRQEVTSLRPAFALSMMDDGGMRLVLDLPGVPVDIALQIVGLLKSSGMFEPRGA